MERSIFYIVPNAAVLKQVDAVGGVGGVGEIFLKPFKGKVVDAFSLRHRQQKKGRLIGDRK